MEAPPEMSDDLKINLRVPMVDEPAAIEPILQSEVIPSYVSEVTEKPSSKDGLKLQSDSVGAQTSSLRPSPISGVTPPIATRWKKGHSGNPGGRAKHVSRAYIKHLETIVDEESGETNADKIAMAQIKKASLIFDPGSTAAAREIRQATEGDEDKDKGGFNIGSLNVAILNQITRAATEQPE